MNKRLFGLLVVLMSLSLIGIIFVQSYWINKSVQDKEEQFSNTVTQILNRVVENIEKREVQDYLDEFYKLKDSIGEPKAAHLKNFFFFDRDINSNEIRFYTHGILEEDYDLASTLFDIGSETTTFKNITSTKTTEIFKEEFGLDGKSYALTPVQKIKKIGELASVDRIGMDLAFRELAKSRSIHKRVTRQEIELFLSRELKNSGIDIDYEYGVYSKGLPTKVKSKKFKFSNTSLYKSPLFSDSEGNTNFSLLLTFPKKKRFLIQSILGMAILSLTFTLIIVVAYAGAIYQLIKQKQISKIKSDFINNMTHEFKTPIATINLAVEAIRNPKIINDKEKVLRYLQMIRDENKRMHAQVENVLRISKLEKNQLDISKDREDVHDIIADAITHVELIVADRGGYINTHFNAERSEVLANEMHFTNVMVNILDNAVKYSPDTPKIDVFTELANNFIVIKVQDQGAGMSKSVLKKVFEQFYREHTGDIHNVKGHGLGLAYVKKIIDDHQGEVFAESEKGKGSTFYIKLPLI
ncbi:two-component system, OmpR family, phosphate regulon sensor histidine kinase PhoR [Arenibacter nanhaiticus]|uniref:histidine kinase n=1 Tax=Arenibacter nanhaiticus TaxID=558155 RepID=A0A1M6K2N1_9FLAO|nr:HAMP domain-containing sensor histidine kinase [Arenibacter nanhaiticus]SHJ53231.1 two-component system, OmpR family, phosphate regulon sensor histidine kinase PhoR [Arenibacter nanhaiticus]